MKSALRGPTDWILHYIKSYLLPLIISVQCPLNNGGLISITCAMTIILTTGIAGIERSPWR